MPLIPFSKFALDPVDILVTACRIGHNEIPVWGVFADNGIIYYASSLVEKNRERPAEWLKSR